MEPSCEYLAQITDTPISVVPELTPIYKSGLNSIQDVIFMEMPWEPLNFDEFILNLKITDSAIIKKLDKSTESMAMAEEFFNKLTNSVIVVEKDTINTNNNFIDAENFDTADFIKRISEKDFGKVKAAATMTAEKSVQSHSPIQVNNLNIMLNI